MKIPVFLFVLCTSAVFCVNGQSSLKKCTRPNREEGLCIKYNQCPEILDLLRRHQMKKRELSKYKCGIDGSTIKVCCDYNCYTPEGNLGKCKHVNSCPHLYEMMKSTDNNHKAYVRDSRCLTGDRDVCCGPAPQADFAQPKDNCPEQASAFPPHLNSQCCGLDAQFTARIFGGYNLAVTDYPWLVLLEYKHISGEIKTDCSGSLISNRYVVTAAHCVNSAEDPPIRVRLGEYDTSRDIDCAYGKCADPFMTIRIEDIIIHPEHDPRNNQYDIALLRLASPVPYTDFVRPICLPEANVLHSGANRKVYVAGWGRADTTHISSNVKKHVDLPIVRTEVCQNAYRSILSIRLKLMRNQLCAGGEAGKDACNGDSGGPLMLKTSMKHELVGLVSQGLKECGTEGLPGIYTHVYKYTIWIRRNIRP